MALVFKVYQGPILAVALQDDTAALAAVTTIGTSEGDELFTTEMRRTGAAMPRAGEYLDVIDEIGSCHNIFYLRQR